MVAHACTSTVNHIGIIKFIEITRKQVKRRFPKQIAGDDACVVCSVHLVLCELNSGCEAASCVQVFFIGIVTNDPFNLVRSLKEQIKQLLSNSIEIQLNE